MSEDSLSDRIVPSRFGRLIGVDVDEFDAIVDAVRPVVERIDRHRLYRDDRIRAIGGGPPYRLGMADQVLLVLIRWRHGPTLAGLAGRFGVSPWTVMRILGRVGPAVAAARPALRRDLRGCGVNDEVVAGLFELAGPPHLVRSSPAGVHHG